MLITTRHTDSAEQTRGAVNALTDTQRTRCRVQTGALNPLTDSTFARAVHRLTCCSSMLLRSADTCWAGLTFLVALASSQRQPPPATRSFPPFKATAEIFPPEDWRQSSPQPSRVAYTNLRRSGQSRESVPATRDRKPASSRPYRSRYCGCRN